MPLCLNTACADLSGVAPERTEIYRPDRSVTL